MTDPYLLVPHPPEACVAFGPDRCARDLLSDVAAVRRALPPAAPGSELLVICLDRYHFAVGLLAAWQAGHAVALPPNGQPETIHALAHRPGVLLLLHDVDGGEGLDLRPLLGKGGPVEALAPIDPARRVATLYTSGSTGEHQPCPKVASQLLGEALSHVGTFGLGPGMRVLSTVPSHHIYGLLYSVLVPLLGGGCFLRTTPFHAETIEAQLEEQRIDVLVSVPAHYRGLEVLTGLRLPKRAFSSGAPLPETTARMLRERFGLRVIEVFGSSETGGIAWRDDPAADWTPFAGVVIAAGPEGQLLLESPFVHPDAARPLPCSDRVALLETGGFRLMGRLDGVVKVAGKRVALAEVEGRLLALPGVRDVAAVTADVEGARGQEIWVAVATDRWTPAALRTHLLKWFDPVALPRRIKVLAGLPREENGKITRRRLRALFEDPDRGSRPSVKVLEPVREERASEGGAEVATLEFEVREDLLYFRGHFDGMAILPGVVQLHGLVLRQAKRMWPDLGGVRKIRKLQFKKIIQPRQVVHLRLTRPAGAARVDFELSREGQPCSCGTLLFEGDVTG